VDFPGGWSLSDLFPGGWSLSDLQYETIPSTKLNDFRTKNANSGGIKAREGKGALIKELGGGQ
jgi:hypothetical protein